MTGKGLFKHSSKPALCLLLLVWGSVFSLHGETEYWRDFFYMIDNVSYDKAPLFYHPLGEKEAVSMGDYTVVYLDAKGRLKEALTYQSKRPLYYYYYLYGSETGLRARISYYFQESNRAVKNSLVYYYYQEGYLKATSYFEFSLLTPGEKIRVFTKIYDRERDYKVIDEFSLMGMTELQAVMRANEEQVDRAMREFTGGELFLRELTP